MIEVVEATYKTKKRAYKTRTVSNKPKQRVASKKRAKARTMSWYKKELDRVFSLYVRAKYKKECFTCGYVGRLQNGHFISRQYLPTRWEEDNCRPQCQMCNIWGKGMSVDFEENLIKEIGAARVQQMKNMRKELWRPDLNFYTEKIAYYKDILENGS